MLPTIWSLSAPVRICNGHYRTLSKYGQTPVKTTLNPSAIRNIVKYIMRIEFHLSLYSSSVSNKIELLEFSSLKEYKGVNSMVLDIYSNKPPINLNTVYSINLIRLS